MLFLSLLDSQYCCNACQQVSAFLLRLGRHYPEPRKTWTKAHMNWLAGQKFEYPQQRLVFEEMMLAIRQARSA